MNDGSARICVLDYGMGNLRSVEKALEHVGAAAEISSDADLPATSIAGFDTDLTEEFFRAVANSAKLTMHVWVRSGTNAHHMIEAAFKAFARALRVAVSVDPDEPGVPSTKGTLTE